jgi:hypothetical protein
MNRLLFTLLMGLITFGSMNAALAKKAKPQPVAEPAFCDPKTFLSHEVPSSTEGLVRNHTYQIGELTLVGLAVGKSEVSATQALADDYSRYNDSEKSCTWYYNTGNDLAAEAFTQIPLSNPIWKSASSLVKEYSAALENTFDQDENNFVACATRHRYLAMGCDGMRHRGPSVFAMFLSFAGCSPKSSVEIVEKVWGHNFVNTSKRIAMAEKAYEMGSQRPASRQALQNLLLK